MVCSLLALAGLAWVYTLYHVGQMQAMTDSMRMPSVGPWQPVDLLAVFAMWVIMMAAMMIPSVIPSVTLFATVNRRRRERGQPFVPAAVFFLGYLAAWTGFSGAATVAQWGLHGAALLSEMMESRSTAFGGLALLAAGVYQWTPLKHVCLTRCRSPLTFFMTQWREGNLGALLMGVKHGTYCVGCCWALMLVLFAVGVMNVLWIAFLASFVLAEKVAAGGPWLGRLGGLALIGWGIWMWALG